jgi:hypothetical protein
LLMMEFVENNSAFARLLNRLGGENGLICELSLNTMYMILKYLLAHGHLSYGNLANGIVEVLGNSEEKNNSACISQGYNDEFVAYSAFLSNGPFTVPQILGFVNSDRSELCELLHGGLSDGEWIRTTDDGWAIIGQERGGIHHTTSVSSSDDLDNYIASRLLIPLRKRPKRREFQETLVKACEHPDYMGFFRQLRMGRPAEHIKQNMQLGTQSNRLDVTVLDEPDRLIILKQIDEENQSYTRDAWDYYIID